MSDSDPLRLPELNFPLTEIRCRAIFEKIPNFDWAHSSVVNTEAEGEDNGEPATPDAPLSGAFHLHPFPPENMRLLPKTPAYRKDQRQSSTRSLSTAPGISTA